MVGQLLVACDLSDGEATGTGLDLEKLAKTGETGETVTTVRPPHVQVWVSRKAAPLEVLVLASVLTPILRRSRRGSDESS